MTLRRLEFQAALLTTLNWFALTKVMYPNVKFAQYGDLLRTLARRTFDESGTIRSNLLH